MIAPDEYFVKRMTSGRGNGLKLAVTSLFICRYLQFSGHPPLDGGRWQIRQMQI
jgi:hypothetical protein